MCAGRQVKRNTAGLNELDNGCRGAVRILSLLPSAYLKPYACSARISENEKKKTCTCSLMLCNTILGEKKEKKKELTKKYRAIINK